MGWKDILETTVTGGYPNDGSTGPASDDDLAVGTTVFGDKMVPVIVPNRLTGATKRYVPADELGQDWNYDEFDNSSGMGSDKSYSKTLTSLKGILGDRLWKHTATKKFRLQTDKYTKRASNDIDQTSKLSDDEEETMDITERIRKFVDEEEVEMVNESVLASPDRKTLAKAIMKGKNMKVKLTSLGIEAVITNYDEEVVITYPKNDDFTMSLVDIADSLGMDFRKTKDGNKEAMRLMK